jgi:hypothetical protein
MTTRPSRSPRRSSRRVCSHIATWGSLPVPSIWSGLSASIRAASFGPPDPRRRETQIATDLRPSLSRRGARCGLRSGRRSRAAQPARRGLAQGFWRLWQTLRRPLGRAVPDCRSTRKQAVQSGGRARDLLGAQRGYRRQERAPGRLVAAVLGLLRRPRAEVGRTAVQPSRRQRPRVQS